MLGFVTNYMSQRIELFFESYREVLRDMPEEELRNNANAVIETLLEKRKNLDEVSGLPRPIP